MSEFLLTLASVILAIIVWISGLDISNYARAIVRLEDVAQKAASCAIEFYDSTEYAQGYIEFNDEESLKAVNYFIESRLNLNTNRIPKANAYWSDTPDVIVYMFDETLHSEEEGRGEMRMYQNGALMNIEPFEFGNVFDEPLSGRSKAIVGPTIAVVIHTGQPKFIASAVNTKAAMSGFYSWADRDALINDGDT